MIRKFVVTLLLCVPWAVLAQDQGQERDSKRVGAENVIRTTATVESVDQDSRSLVLRNSEGKRLLVMVGPEVRNFEQIEPGDRIEATYREALLAEVLPKGSRPEAPSATVAESRADPGERPAGAVAASVSTDVVIESVDRSFDTVTFRRDDGIVRTVAVDTPKAAQFVRNLKPGDEVRVTYTEATAIAVNPTE
jgi:hypothetical protein